MRIVICTLGVRSALQFIKKKAQINKVVFVITSIASLTEGSSLCVSHTNSFFLLHFLMRTNSVFGSTESELRVLEVSFSSSS